MGGWICKDGIQKKAIRERFKGHCPAMNPHLNPFSFYSNLISLDTDKQKQDAIATNERLGTEVETVLNVIEDPSVAASLKQDKAQNLQWLEENYKVSNQPLYTAQ